jgi:hypothetical protein
MRRCCATGNGNCSPRRPPVRMSGPPRTWIFRLRPRNSKKCGTRSSTCVACSVSSTSSGRTAQLTPALLAAPIPALALSIPKRLRRRGASGGRPSSRSRITKSMNCTGTSRDAPKITRPHGHLRTRPSQPSGPHHQGQRPHPARAKGAYGPDRMPGSCRPRRGYPCPGPKGPKVPDPGRIQRAMTGSQNSAEQAMGTGWPGSGYPAMAATGPRSRQAVTIGL